MTQIHQTATIEDGAVLADDIVVGPFSFVGAGVRIGSESVLHSHVVVVGDTHIGENARIFPFASIGHQPQDLKFSGEPSRLCIGRNCMIRENVTINPGTEGGGLVTEIGDDCVMLAGSHVAHDCRIGDKVVLANNVMVGGHCAIGDHVFLGGGAAVHQWVRIGPHAFVGGLSGLENDLIPFGTAIGNRAQLGGLNILGLRRRSFPREEIHALRRAYRLLFGDEGTLKSRAEILAAEFSGVEPVQQLVAFVRAGGDRALCMPRTRDPAD